MTMKPLRALVLCALGAATAPLPSCGGHGRPTAANVGSPLANDTYNQVAEIVKASKNGNDLCTIRESWNLPASPTGGTPCFDMRDAFTARTINVGWFPFRVAKQVGIYSGAMDPAKCPAWDDMCPKGDAGSQGVLLATLKPGDFVGLQSAAFNYAPTSAKCDDGPECRSTKRGDACSTSHTNTDGGTNDPTLRPGVNVGTVRYYWGYGYGRGGLEGTDAGFVPYATDTLQFAGFDPTHPCAGGAEYDDFEVHGGCDFTHNGTFGDHGDQQTKCTGPKVNGVAQPNPTCGDQNDCAEGWDDCGICGGTKNEPLAAGAHVRDSAILKKDVVSHGVRIAQINKCCVPPKASNTTGYCIVAGNKPAGYDSSTQCKTAANRAYHDGLYIRSFGVPVYWAQGSNRRTWSHVNDRFLVHAYTRDSTTSHTAWAFVELAQSDHDGFAPRVTDDAGQTLVDAGGNRDICQRIDENGNAVAATCGWVPRALLVEEGAFLGQCASNDVCAGSNAGTQCVGDGDDRHCGCRADADCPSPLVCDPLGNFCDVKPVEPPPCLGDADCATGTLCADGECVHPTSCTTNDQCTDVTLGHACVGGTCGCDGDTDCFDGDVCVVAEHRCYDAPPPIPCAAASDCAASPNGHQCIGGLCRCGANADCASGYCNADGICDPQNGACDPGNPSACQGSPYGAVCNPTLGKCGCTTGADCPGGQGCLDSGTCITVGGGMEDQPCVEDQECTDDDDGFACVDGHCGCRGAQDCPGGEGCIGGECVTSGVAAPTQTGCAANVDCIGNDLGSACVIQPDGTTRCGCTSDAQCVGSPGGHACDLASRRCGGAVAP